MLIKAAINGGRARASHAATPISIDEIVLDVGRVLEAGADVVHFHPRTDSGEQTIAPQDSDPAIAAIRAKFPDAVIGITTGLWTCSGPQERYEHVRGWSELPDFASVAFSEDGATETAELLRARGIAVESAVWTVDDVPALLASPVLDDNIRVLIEPMEDDPATAVEHARQMAALLRAGGVRSPLLYHGEGTTVWPVMRAAIADGAQIRVGFEDGILLPDGQLAPDNAALVRAARALVARSAP